MTERTRMDSDQPGGAPFEWPYGLTPEEMGALLSEVATESEAWAGMIASFRRLAAVVGEELPVPATPWERDALVESGRAKVESLI